MGYEYLSTRTSLRDISRFRGLICNAVGSVTKTTTLEQQLGLKQSGLKAVMHKGSEQCTVKVEGWTCCTACGASALTTIS